MARLCQQSASHGLDGFSRLTTSEGTGQRFCSPTSISGCMTFSPMPVSVNTCSCARHVISIIVQPDKLVVDYAHSHSFVPPPLGHSPRPRCGLCEEASRAAGEGWWSGRPGGDSGEGWIRGVAGAIIDTCMSMCPLYQMVRGWKASVPALLPDWLPPWHTRSSRSSLASSRLTQRGGSNLHADWRPGGPDVLYSFMVKQVWICRCGSVGKQNQLCISNTLDVH